MKPNNLFSQIPDSRAAEVVDGILQTGAFQLERIVSWGQATPSGEWYDQDTNEWVILLRGSAVLLFEDEPGEVVLHPGDYVHIPARQRHRVEWTDPEKKTVWLALHYK